VLRRFVIGLFIFILATSGLRSTPIRAASASFPNGGFETRPAGGQNDWTLPASDWVWDSAAAHTGTHSVRVGRSSGDETVSLWSAYIAVQPSTVYTLTYWLRTQNATFYPRVGLSQYTSTKAQTGLSLIAYANIGNGTNGWMPVTYRFQTMPDAATLRVWIYLYTDTTGTFWFDDFDLDQGPPAHFPFHRGFPVVASGWVWLSSPIVADINHDGKNELLIGAGDEINGWDKTGTPLPGYPLPTGDWLVVSQIAVADLDNDGNLEIVAGTRTLTTDGGCHVFVWRPTGALLNGWPQTVAWNNQYSYNDCSITSVVLADIDGDHALEILASTSDNGARDPYADIAVPNLYAWRANGSLVPGNWPNWHTTAGIYGAVAAGDLNGDGKSDVVVGRDYLYLYAYAPNGAFLPGWPIKTYVKGNGGNYDVDARIEYSVNAPIIADLEGDGRPEIIVAGHVKGPGGPDDVVLNSGLLVLEPDGRRRPGWESAALGNGVLAQEDLPWQAPAVADLNRDGQLEIVVATHDGWIRAHKADKTLLWAFNYTQGATLFAGDPVIGDIDGNGTQEIVFATYVPLLKDSDRDGPVGLWALEADGTVVPGFPLPVSTPGVRAAPTLADLDGDGKLEILAATRTGQIFVWDTSAPYVPARLPWPTGRHDIRRSAAYMLTKPTFASSYMAAIPSAARKNETSTFTVRVVSDVPTTYTVRLTDTIPAGLAYVPGTLTATLGSVTATANMMQWSGVLSKTPMADVKFDVVVTTDATQMIRNAVVIDTPTDGVLTRTAVIVANGLSTYLTAIMGNSDWNAP
jgi:uncharacterized repeat protein (TIGR01451 family)